MSKKIVVISHAVFTKDGKPLHGSGSALESYLTNKNVVATFIKLPIVDQHPIWVQTKGLTINNFHKVKYISTNFLPIRALYELLQTYLLLKDKLKIDLFIGINPLNTTYGLLLKPWLKIDKIIYYTADYAHQRFANPLLNWFYHLLDRWCISKAHQVWNVSTRITKLRKSQGIVCNNFFVPNSPEFDKVDRLAKNKKNKFELIIVSSSPTAVNIPLCLKALAILKKKYPKISLKVIGLGKWSTEFNSLISKLKINNSVKFEGSMPHQQLEQELSKAGLGLALYTNQSPWTFYSDSMKVRDYLAVGLPTIMTDVLSTAEDIKTYKAGEVVNLDFKELVKAIDKIMNKNNYQKYHHQALKLAQKQDIKKILDKILLPLIS